MTDAVSPGASIRLIGGPTVVIEIGGLRLLTDPTFDGPRTFEEGGATVVTKLVGPAVTIEEIGAVDAVLQSHDEHPDNLDDAGRGVLARATTVLTTPDGAQRLGGGARGLAPWDTTTVTGADGQEVTITAVPAQHGPTPDADAVSGHVIGFLIADPAGTRVYVSGDNASVDVVREIVARAGVPEVSVLFMGAASLPFLFDGDFVTLTAAQAAEAGGVLDGSVVVPAHLNGWSHYTDTEADVVRAFAAAGRADQLHLLGPGDTYASG